MALIAGALVVGAGVAASGQVGAAKMSEQEGYESYSQGIYNPSAQNPLAMGQYWLSILLGLYDPSLLNQAGPLDSAMAQFKTAPFAYGAGRSGEERITVRIQATKGHYAAYAEARAAGQSPEQAMQALGPDSAWPGLSGDVIPSSGYNTAQELFEAEYEHQQRIDEIGLLGEQLAGVSRESIANYINKTSEIMADLPGMDQGEIDEYKAAELARINQELDQQVEQAQRRANIGGYNPGREIERIEERRTNADSVALERALALIQGEQGVAGTSMGLLKSGSGLYNNVSLAGNLSQASTPVFLGGGTTNFGANTQQAGYLADAAGTIGSGIGNAALAYGMGRSPGWTPPTAVAGDKYGYA